MIAKFALFFTLTLSAITSMLYSGVSEASFLGSRSKIIGMPMKPYFGISYSPLMSTVQSDKSGGPTYFTTTTGNNIGVHAGLRVHRYFGMQIGYTSVKAMLISDENTGNILSNGTSANSTIKPNLRNQFEAISIDLLLHSPSLELSDDVELELVANIGTAYVMFTGIYTTATESTATSGPADSTASGATNNVAATLRPPIDDHSMALKYGIGINTAFMGLVAVRAGIDVLRFYGGYIGISSAVYYNIGLSVYLF